MTSLLIVDDSRAARMMLKHWVKMIRPAYAVVEAGNAEEAVETAKAIRGDLLAIVDYNMPGENGIELAKNLMTRIPPKRITLCTANIQEAVRKRAETLGIHYMAKPLNPGKVRDIFLSMESA